MRSDNRVFVDVQRMEIPDRVTPKPEGVVRQSATKSEDSFDTFGEAGQNEIFVEGQFTGQTRFVRRPLDLTRIEGLSRAIPLEHVLDDIVWSEVVLYVHTRLFGEPRKRSRGSLHIRDRTARNGGCQVTSTPPSWRQIVSLGPA
jgi:hypothetical protein